MKEPGEVKTGKSIAMKTQRVRVPGGEVVAYSFGKGEETVVTVSNGPGVSCDYTREASC